MMLACCSQAQEDGNGLGMGQRNDLKNRGSDQRRNGQSSSDHFTERVIGVHEHRVQKVPWSC
jgi:hypothetical protein